MGPPLKLRKDAEVLGQGTILLLVLIGQKLTCATGPPLIFFGELPVAMGSSLVCGLLGGCALFLGAALEIVG
jgi:hypothetical protein